MNPVKESSTKGLDTIFRAFSGLKPVKGVAAWKQWRNVTSKGLAVQGVHWS